MSHICIETLAHEGFSVLTTKQGLEYLIGYGLAINDNIVKLANQTSVDDVLNELSADVRRFKIEHSNVMFVEDLPF